MQNLVPVPLADRAPIPAFAPVPRKYRYDGWTADRQRAFIDALAELGSVKRAAKRINMSPEGAYYLRRQPGAEEFRAAWDSALDHGVQRLTDIAIDRAIEGVAVPVFWRGEQVGEKRRYNDRLLMFILRHHQPGRYGALPAPAERRREAEEAARAAAEDARHADEEAERAETTIRTRLNSIREGFKRGIRNDPAKRAAWELLVGPTDWGDLSATPPMWGLTETNLNRPDMILPFADGTGDAEEED